MRMQMFHVQGKPTGSQFSLPHELNQKVNERTKRETHWTVHEGSPMEGVESVVGGINFLKGFQARLERFALPLYIVNITVTVSLLTTMFYRVV